MKIEISVSANFSPPPRSWKGGQADQEFAPMVTSANRRIELGEAEGQICWTSKLSKLPRAS
jgi:hypothetical protein